MRETVTISHEEDDRLTRAMEDAEDIRAIDRARGGPGQGVPATVADGHRSPG